MKIAICQMEIAYENKSKNLENMTKKIIQAAEKNSEIIFFPEMTLTGFSMNIKETCEKNKKNIDYIKNLALKNKINIGFGYVKPNNEQAENHYTIISKGGEVLCDYIKIHPFSYSNEDKFFIAGNKVVNYFINDIPISNFICYDLRFPEIFQAISNKVSIIVVVANWPQNRIEHWKTLLKARAIENQCYIIGVNCCGTQANLVYSGNSCVYNPNGDLVCDLGNSEKIEIFNFLDDISQYRTAFPLKTDRKNKFYKSLL